MEKISSVVRFTSNSVCRSIRDELAFVGYPAKAVYKKTRIAFNSEKLQKRIYKQQENPVGCSDKLDCCASRLGFIPWNPK